MLEKANCGAWLLVIELGLSVAACGGRTGKDGAGGSKDPNGTAGGAGGAGSVGAAGRVADGGAGAEVLPTDREIDAATVRIASSVCAHLFACCRADYIASFYADEVDCRVSYGAHLRIAALTNRDTAAGRVAIHLEVAERCPDTPAVCDDASPWSCSKGIFEPLVPLGGTCVFSTECIEGRCDSVTKRCAPTLPDGSECVFHEDCTSGYCDFVTCAASTAEPNESCS